MKHLIISILIVLLYTFSVAQNGKLPELIADKYAILKSTPDDARSIMLRISLKNKDSMSHQGYLKVDIRDQEGQLFFQNEKKIILDTGKTTESSYNIVFVNPGEYSIHYIYSDGSGQLLEKTFSWETKPVNFFYSFATPHRLTVTLPDDSNKTLLDLYEGKLDISWTFDNLVYYPFDAFRVPRSDWKISIQPHIHDKPFSNSEWERSDGYLPILKNTYKDQDATVILEVAGADSAAIVKITLINRSNTSQCIKLPCVCPGGWKGYNPGWIDNTLPTDYLLAGWNAPADKILILGIGADYFPVDPVITTQLNMVWELKPGETKTGWLIRPYNSFARDAAYLKTINWEEKFNRSKEIWKSLIDRACRLTIPDPGIVNGFYASVADIFVMREPIGKGYLGIVPGTEVYRSCPSAFEPAIATVALDQIGLHQEAELGYRVNWNIQTPDGDWSEPGGWAHLMWGASGYKAWALMEHFFDTCDTTFLIKHYPQMLACSRWQNLERQKTKMYVHGKKQLTYGLMPRGMGDGGLMDDNSYYGIFYTHNIWAVFEDSLAYRAAMILNRQEEARELRQIYETSRSDLITAMERGAIIDGNGTRRLSSLPGKISGSCWGLLNAIYPAGILPGNHELMNNTIGYIERRMSPGGIPVHTGWMADGMWVAITLNDFAEAHLARNEGDIANSMLYSTLNHGTPLYTWCEERGQDPDTKETSGDRQHLWTPVAVVRCTRDIMIMEDGNTLHLLRGIARGWLTSGEYTGIENASSHFGQISFKVRFDKDKSQLTGEINFPKESRNFRTILHCPLSDKMRVAKASTGTVLPDGSGIEFVKCTGDIYFTAKVKK
jgi:hypothetical protein